MNKILIANRGEIAVRIIRACKEMNIKTVAVYSEADKDSLHTRLADEAICIGPANSDKSYLNYKNIIEAAYLTGADSIHPGFGFLSENSQFAKICEESNIKFIGPSYEVIKLMGNKSNAKEMMEKAGVPVVPGSKGSIKSINDAKKTAKEIGYPIMLKAAAGGGGKGIRIVNDENELENSYNIVKQEAMISFKDDEIYMEKFVQNPRHVEIQILADEHGNVIHLGERDCTVQRRNQKVIEETGSTAIDDKLREKMGESAIKAAKKVGYTSCGTVEFLVDKNKNFYFMEMNTRIQVEHGITEERTGIDIVKERIIGFAKLRIPEGKFKVVILDEADAMTNGAQTALRKVMEDYPNTRFCIICNYPEKIIPAIVSRCMEFRFNSIGDEFIKVHLTRIYQKEFGTNPNDNIINTIIMLSDGDLRKCINMLQNFKYSNNCCDKEVFYQMEGLMDEETLDKFINDSKNIKTKDDMIRLNDEIKRTNYSIKNIIKQILMKDKTKETELKKLLNDEIDNDFVLIGLINELRK